MLQSVFIIRSVNDDRLAQNSSIQLVAASLFASLFSISNKYTWLDKYAFEETAQDAKFRAKCPFVNPWCALRIIWRFSYVATRFCVLSLIWSVLGGAALGFFLCVSFFCWCIPFVIVEWIMDPREDLNILDCPLVFASSCGFGLCSLIATPAGEKYVYACTHGLEMTISLTLITIFAYMEFECNLCNNSTVLLQPVATFVSKYINEPKFNFHNCFIHFDSYY